jgi:hypothetical protein
MLQMMRKHTALTGTNRALYSSEYCEQTVIQELRKEFYMHVGIEILHTSTVSVHITVRYASENCPF